MSASAEDLQNTSTADLAVERVLEHLSREHALVVLCDEHDLVTWVRDPHQLLSLRGREQLGRPLRDVFPSCPGRTCGHELLDLKTEDGATIEMDVRSFPVLSAPGSRVIVARRAEDLRREATHLGGRAAFLSAMLDNSPDAVLAADLGGFVTFANDAASELLGHPVAELVGRPLVSWFPCRRDVAEMLDKLLDQDLTGHELELPSEDGSRWASISSRRMRLANGKVFGNVVFVRDVSERRRAEQTQAAKNEELENCIRHVAHDLRSPLLSVIGFTRLLREDPDSPLGPDAHRFLERIDQAGRTMEALVEDLLEVSCLGRVGEPESRVDPLGVLQQVCADHKMQLEHSDTEIELPEHPPVLYCGRTRAYQLFSNLIGNALLHMDPVAAPRISVTIDEDAEFHYIRVADNGKGVAAVHHEEIFEAFTSLGERPAGSRSTGIGLAIVRKIATSYGGSAWVESEPDRGATFHVTLRKA